MRNEPTTIKLQIGANLKEVAYINPAFFTSPHDYQGSDFTRIISVMPEGRKTNLCPVQVQYGMKIPIFTLPPSNYMMAGFTAGHLDSIQVKPMLKAMKREEMQAYATDLMTKLKNATGMKWSPETSDVPVMSIEEMTLRMQVRRKDMDTKSFRLGHWESEEDFGTAYIWLYVYAFDLEDVPPEDQYYGIQMNIDGGRLLQSYLSSLLNYFKEHYELYDARTKKRCMPAAGPCQIDDLRDYVEQLKNADLSPLEKIQPREKGTLNSIIKGKPYSAPKYIKQKSEN